jgi:hypothetical protein
VRVKIYTVLGMGVGLVPYRQGSSCCTLHFSSLLTSENCNGFRGNGMLIGEYVVREFNVNFFSILLLTTFTGQIHYFIFNSCLT